MYIAGVFLWFYNNHSSQRQKLLLTHKEIQKIGEGCKESKGFQ